MLLIKYKAFEGPISTVIEKLQPYKKSLQRIELKVSLQRMIVKFILNVVNIH